MSKTTSFRPCHPMEMKAGKFPPPYMSRSMPSNASRKTVCFPTAG